MIKSFLYISLLSAPLLGCLNPYASNFDCPERDGLKCASLTKVNRAIDQGDIDTGDIIELEKAPPIESPDIYFTPSFLLNDKAPFNPFTEIY